MELSWSRFETHRSPKGHGLRARARGRTVEAWQDASGRWRVRSTSAPQTTPDFRSWPEARQWAEKRIAANPNPEHRPQAVHRSKNARRKNRQVPTDTGTYDTETWVELVDAETGDIDYEGPLDDLLAQGVIKMPTEDVLERMSRRGFVDFRSSVLREASSSANPKAGLGMKVELVDEDDDRIEWRGTLGQFLAGNEGIDRDATLLALEQGYEIGFGGGASPMMVLRPAEQRAANPRRAMNPTNPSKVDAHKANQLRLFIDGTILGGDEGIMKERRDLDVRATRMVRAMRQIGGRSSFHLDEDIAMRHYMPMVETAYARYLRKGGTAMNKPTRQYVASELGQDLVWELEGERKRGAEARNPAMQVSHAWAISKGTPGRERRVAWYKCYEFKGGGRWCGWVESHPDRYLSFDTGSSWMEDREKRDDVKAAIWDWEATHDTVGPGKDDREKNTMRRNPRGKHIACGSRIGKKDCRQLQHVYTSAKKRGFSDERAAKQAWGSLRRNPAMPFATVKRFLAISNPAKGARGEPDTIAGDELELWIDNTEPLYRKWQAIVKNLWRHQAKGRYDHERAVDGFMYLVDDGARHYTKEFGGKWNEIFDAPTRRYVANEYAKSFENNQRDEIQYAPPGAKHNPPEDYAGGGGDYQSQIAWNVYLGGEKVDTVFFAPSMSADDVLNSLINHDNYDPAITVRRASKRNPPPFDTLSTADQAKALTAYWKGLEVGAAGDDVAWTGRMAAFAEAGMQDAQVALGGARANNPTPPQIAWVVVDEGKPVGLFFAERPIEIALADKVANGPGGRMRNGAGLGAFLGSLSGSVVGTVLAAVGAMPAMGVGGVLLAPLSLLLSMAGGAIGGHVAAPRDRKKRGAIGGGVGGVFGPLGAALGGYIGGRKPDKRRNPTTRYPAKKNTCGCTHARARRLARNLCA